MPPEALQRCSMCGIERPLSEFHRRGEGHQLWCKACRKPYDAEYFARTRLVRIAQKEERRRQLMQWVADVKRSQPCVDCGGWFHPAAMHFDHLPGHVKQGDVSTLAREGCTKLTKEEILKCDLVCANCHALRTYMRRTYGDSFEEAPGRYAFALVA